MSATNESPHHEIDHIVALMLEYGPSELVDVISRAIAQLGIQVPR